MLQAYPTDSHVRWFWRNGNDPFSPIQHEEEWRCYSDVETAIIEEAFQIKRPQALLDKYHIDFEHSVQISNNNLKKQRPVKRVINRLDEAPLRAERFTTTSIIPIRSFINPRHVSYGAFFREVENFCEVPFMSRPFERACVRRRIVEKAAAGLTIEGKTAGQQKSAEWLAEQLLKEKEESIRKIWSCCARLYCMQCFLYEKLNEVMRLIGDSKHEIFWREKVSTLGPFALILWRFGDFEKTREATLYRGANLSNDLISQYQEKCVAPSEATSETPFIFPACTSTSLDRSKAEQYGNVLFRIKIQSGDGWNMMPYSPYYYEEEILLRPYFCFNIVLCEFNSVINKWVIDLVSNTILVLPDWIPAK